MIMGERVPALKSSKYIFWLPKQGDEPQKKLDGRLPQKKMMQQQETPPAKSSEKCPAHLKFWGDLHKGNKNWGWYMKAPTQLLMGSWGF